MKQVADEIKSGGIGTFLNYITNKNYGPKFFTESIRSGPETRGSDSPFVPSDVAFGLKTAAWGQKYFRNDELRHMIGTFMVAENYGSISADMITTGNEMFGLLTIDIPNWLNGNPSSAFEFHDYLNNHAGLMLWTSYSITK